MTLEELAKELAKAKADLGAVPPDLLAGLDFLGDELAALNAAAAIRRRVERLQAELDQRKGK